MNSKKNSKQPLIFEIKGNSWEDGPGIRSVVFLKGCPLNCVWCQNPESKKSASELWWEPQRCIKDGACMEVCPKSAISPKFRFFVDRELCASCFQCVEACPSTALSRTGRNISVDEIVRDVVSYKPYFDASGGGVTLSGGEPTLHMEFISKLLKRLKKEGIHTLLQTAGFFHLETFETLVLPYLDTIHFDIKLIDSAEHEQFCGVKNERILQNFVALNNKLPSGGFELRPRTPLIPGITDTDANIHGIAEFYSKHQVRKAVLQLNNPVWLQKFDNLGKETTTGLKSRLGKFYDTDKSLKLKDLFLKRGIEISFE